MEYLDLNGLKLYRAKILGICTATTSSKIGNFSYSHNYGEFIKKYADKCEIKLWIWAFDCLLINLLLV